MAGNHGFADGNKRTTLILIHSLITNSNYILEPLPGEDIQQAIEDLILSAAAEILTWTASVFGFNNAYAALYVRT